MVLFVEGTYMMYFVYLIENLFVIEIFQVGSRIKRATGDIIKEMAQDLPPIGGYEPIQWKRNLPLRGFHPLVYFFGLCGLTSYGFYRVILGNREMYELKREKMWSRIYLLPLLQLEQDRDMVRRTLLHHKREGEMMSNIPWWEVKSTYHDDAFHPPTTTIFGKRLDPDSYLIFSDTKDRFSKE